MDKEEVKKKPEFILRYYRRKKIYENLKNSITGLVSKDNVINLHILKNQNIK